MLFLLFTEEMMTQRDMCVPADNPLAAFVTNALPQAGGTGSPNFPPMPPSEMGGGGSPLVKMGLREGFEGMEILGEHETRKNGIMKEGGENNKEVKDCGDSPGILANVSLMAMSLCLE